MNRELPAANTPHSRWLQAFCTSDAGLYGRPRDYVFIDQSTQMPVASLSFQDGDPKAGVNGVTNEAVIAVLIDRLRLWSADCRTTAKIDHAKRHLLAALALLEEDFAEPWAEDNNAGPA